MATKNPDTKDPNDTDDVEEAPASDAAGVVVAGGQDAEDPPPEEEVDPEGTVPAVLGAKKYVHAFFFGFGILVAFLSSKILLMVWNNLAEWPTAANAVPQLLRYAEEERATFTTIAGALVGVATVIQTYRKERVRNYADDVALELTKVTWPNKETVTNGTIVVVVASAIATVYVTLLDRFWGFVTTLVYGA
jgi:preprotein translocase subunit SecE